MDTKSFSIIAATFHGNRGAQAMLETVIGRLSDADPQLRFNVFSYYPREDRQLVADPRVRIYSSTPLALVLWMFRWAVMFGLLRVLLGRWVLRLAPGSIRALGTSKALVDLAGVAFIDGREKFLPFNVLTLLPARLLGTPVVKMPQAVGPFANTANRLAAAVVLPMCRMVWARGARTREHLLQAPFDGVTFAQADDIAFNFQERWSLTHEGGGQLESVLNALDVRRSDPGFRGVIGICPSSVVAVKSRQQGGRYEAVLSDLLVELDAQGFAVLLFPNATRAASGEAERNNDLPLIRRIQAAATASGIAHPPLVVDFDVNAASIKAVIARMDMVLVSRFHAMVGALSLAVPAAVLGWSHKYAEVMARFGLEDCVMDYQQLDAAGLRRAVEQVFERRGEIGRVIQSRIGEVRASAERPVTALLTDALGADLA